MFARLRTDVRSTARSGPLCSPPWRSSPGACSRGRRARTGRKIVYRVRPYDTLWTIAEAHYGGDPRNAIWQIETREPPRPGPRSARARSSSCRRRRPGPRGCEGYDRGPWTSTSSSSAPPAARPRPAAGRARCSSAAAATGCSSTAARAPSGSSCAPRSGSSTSRRSSSPISTPTTTSACPGC